MTKKGWLFLIFDGVLLLFLFLASSTDLILKERVEEIHKITVMVHSSTSGTMENFKAGINKAAIEEKMDVNFIDLSTFEDVDGRVQALAREMENGSAGLILSCEEEAEAMALIEAMPVGKPVVVYNTVLGDVPRVRGHVGADDTEEIKILLEGVLQARQAGQDIALVEQKNTTARISAIHHKIETAFSDEGIVVRRVVLEDLTMATTAARGLARQSGNILVSADLAMVQGLGEGCRAYGLEIPLFGMGWNLSCRGLLEGGQIDGLVVHRSYEAGYLAARNTAAFLKSGGKVSAEYETVESQMITPGNMYLSPTSTFLFPYL